MKASIYVRTSTTEQHPEKQLDDCREFCKARGYSIEGEYIEKLSGFKDVNRSQYELVKQKAFSGEIRAVIVWALDRWVRNRDTLLEDVTVLRSYGCKLHSIKEQWLEAINIDGSLGKTIQEFLLGLIGSLAELESQRKSERVKMAYSHYQKQNRKYKKWGRKALPERVLKEVLSFHNKGKSIRWISQNVFYYDKNNNKKNLSIGSVHKITSQK